ncbi:hypothetical protein DM860_010786 [Cuscuta australis]|uniref:Uncharacterized protein n=1 Tax=Cuscuta australis TaxID=267555 RepID=A0A328DZV7_9ASTE|nr:hypothetical protein DM860_010786 [Cuscuta australis]
MNLKIASPPLQCPYIIMPKASSSKNPSRTNQIIVLGSLFLNPVRGTNLLTIRRNCGVNLYGREMGDEPFEIREGLAEEFNIHGEEKTAGSNMKNEGCCVIFERNPTTSRYRENYLKFPSKTDLLDPAMLGIQPDPPNWPERQSVINLSIEHKAKSFMLPLSLRLIKKKLQWEVRDLGESSSSCSFGNAFSSMVSIIVELQTYALKMMEVLWDKDMESIITKAQRDIRSTYIWIFQRVFSQTPALMLYVMIFVANFSLYSGFHNAAVAETLLSRPVCSSCVIAEEELTRTKTDIELWNSFMKEAKKMRSLDEAGLGDHQVMERLVAPISVQVESDQFVDYFRTDFMYQVMLSHDPCNTLLLCNYAQFLQLVARDYDRAEELYKWALQVEPADAEVLSHYAAFLWTVRKESGRAEEMYLQAIAVEPGNPYYASQYASFLWSSSGEECWGSHMNASSLS